MSDGKLPGCPVTFASVSVFLVNTSVLLVTVVHPASPPAYQITIALCSQKLQVCGFVSVFFLSLFLWMQESGSCLSVEPQEVTGRLVAVAILSEEQVELEGLFPRSHGAFTPCPLPSLWACPACLSLSVGADSSWHIVPDRQCALCDLLSGMEWSLHLTCLSEVCY